MATQRTSPIRRTANRMIKWGFRINTTGKWGKRAGVGAAGAGIGAIGAFGVARHVGSAGRLSVLPHGTGDAVRQIYHMSGLGSRIPAVDWAVNTHGPRIGAAIRKQGKRLSAWAMKSPKRMDRAQRAWAFGVRHRVPFRAAKLTKVGVGVALGGLAAQKAGSWMIRRGFGAHPGVVKKRVGRFFGMGG